MTQPTYRIVPQSVILYGVEKTEPDNAPRILLTCPTEAAADAWIRKGRVCPTTALKVDRALVER
jgi:hypothetical protein